MTSSDGISPAAITVMNGTHSVDASILLKSNLLVSSSGNLTVSENISDGGLHKSLTLDGGGELILGGNDTYTGGTVVNSGILVLDSNTAMANGTGLIVGPGGSMIFDPSAGTAGPMVSLAILPSTVPEPGTLMLLGVGALACWSKHGDGGDHPHSFC